MSELLTAFGLGNQAILLNTCMLPLYPGLIAFLAGNTGSQRSRRATAWLGVLVLAGILSMALLVGLVFHLLQQTLTPFLQTLLPILYVVVIVFGALMVFDRNPFARLATAQAPLLRNPYVTAYLYGLLLGPMTLPCVGPFVVSGVFVVGAKGGGALVDGLLFFLAFGLGFGWPLVVLPLATRPVQRWFLGRLTRYHDALVRASGILLVAVGVFGIVTELLPVWRAGIDISGGFKFAYWLAVAVVTLAVAIYTYRMHSRAERHDKALKNRQEQTI